MFSLMYKILLKKKLKLFQKIILFSNIISLFFNLTFYTIKRKKFKFFNTNLFKFSDCFIFKLNIKAYKDISKYLNVKFNINNKESSKMQIFKKEIKIKITGLFNKINHIIWLINKIGDEFEIKFVKNNRDYLIYNIFGNEDIKSKYNNAVKIAIYTENFMPDFNLADYAIGHYHIILQDILIFKNKI